MIATPTKLMQRNSRSTRIAQILSNSKNRANSRLKIG